MYSWSPISDVLKHKFTGLVNSDADQLDSNFHSHKGVPKDQFVIKIAINFSECLFHEYTTLHRVNKGYFYFFFDGDVEGRELTAVKVDGPGQGGLEQVLLMLRVKLSVIPTQ